MTSVLLQQCHDFFLKSTKEIKEYFNIKDGVDILSFSFETLKKIQEFYNSIPKNIGKNDPMILEFIESVNYNCDFTWSYIRNIYIMVSMLRRYIYTYCHYQLEKKNPDNDPKITEDEYDIIYEKYMKILNIYYSYTLLEMELNEKIKYNL